MHRVKRLIHITFNITLIYLLVMTGGVGRFSFTLYAQTTFDGCLQDDASGHALRFNSATGNYKFFQNGGNASTISGKGVVTQKGNIISLQHFSTDRRILATVDKGLNKGSASVQIFALGGTFTIADRNITNNNCPSDGPDETEGETASPAVVNITGVSEATFNAVNSIVTFEITGAMLQSSPETVALLHNEKPVSSSSLQISSNAITFPLGLAEGQNDFTLTASDSQGLQIYKQATVWAGSRTLVVTVFDEANALANGAAVTAKLGDDKEVFSTAMTVNGQVSFTHLPDRTIILDAVASGNRTATRATTGGAGQVQMKLVGFNKPSQIDNNDFHLGTDGWDTGTAPVQIVPHQEALTRTTQAVSVDQDMVVNTSGEGPQSVSRTFEVMPGTKSVTVRYRFITTEVPGGYCGTQFNDSFSVSIRTQSGGAATAESNSMNGLGCGAFDAGGHTSWKEISLTLNSGESSLALISGASKEVVQVDVTVANVADGLLDSQVVVDYVAEKELAITQLKLNDIDNAGLQFLSTAAHSYFNGNTNINGTIKVEGATDDSLTSLVLEVLEGGGVVATADLGSSAESKLIKPFGETGVLQITASQLLFQLPSGEAAQVDGTKNGTVTLRARAKSMNGQEATKEFGNVTKLVRFTGANRYGGRDEVKGGDDWVKPSVKTVIDHFSQLTWGDFSNMNGGNFPPHGSHKTGNDIDGWFSGYNERNQATATTIISHLNDSTYGSRITMVFVAFSMTPTDQFWNAIKDVTLNDGRLAKDVIKPEANHKTHFHWRVKD